MKKILILIAVLVILIAGYIMVEFMRLAQVSQGIPIEKSGAEKSAMLVIDIQKDLTQADGKAPLNIAMTDNMIENVNILVDTCRNKGILVVYVRHEYDKLVFNLLLNDTVKKGSPGSEIDERVAIINDNIFTKHFMDAFSNPAMEKLLRDNNISHLYITGLDAQYCVDKTVQSALNRKYAVTVVSDAIAGKTDAVVAKKLAEFKTLGATIESTEQVFVSTK
ncbi:MAG TPA: isochorismatase family cysteine hydrolase [bacterium]|nr:isochorismatase family cysteine hydrolase [bacterium]HPN45687.1 isochorismatase family cysteine hydrolase [bacterium]